MHHGVSVSSFGHLAMLEDQRRLLALPRGKERFEAYLECMTGHRRGKSDGLIRPLALFNPMSHEHVARQLDAWLSLGAEAVAERSVHESACRLSTPGPTNEVGGLRAALVLVDDVAGAWTNRWLTDFTSRFLDHHHPKKGWAPVVLWASEEPSAEIVERRVAESLWRAVDTLENGLPRSLDAMMKREGRAMRFAGASAASLDQVAIEAVAEILSKLRQSTDRPTQVAALYGDEVAREVGYSPLGVGTMAGFDLALSEALGQPGCLSKG